MAVLGNPGTFEFSPQKHLSSLRREDENSRIGPGYQVLVSTRESNVLLLMRRHRHAPTNGSRITPGKAVWRRPATGSSSAPGCNEARSCSQKPDGLEGFRLSKSAQRRAEPVPEGDEGQRRAGQQLLELLGAQDLAAEIHLPDPRARSGAVQQRRLPRQQALVLGEKTSPVLPITLLIPNTPELLSEGGKTNTTLTNNETIVKKLTQH